MLALLWLPSSTQSLRLCDRLLVPTSRSLIGHSGCISQTQVAESVCDPYTLNVRARTLFWRVAELAAMRDARSV